MKIKIYKINFFWGRKKKKKKKKKCVVSLLVIILGVEIADLVIQMNRWDMSREVGL